jgi:hypothetical protein
MPDQKGSWFAVMWLTHGLKMEKDINYYEMWGRDLINKVLM